MAEVIRTRTISPLTRQKLSQSYKIDTSKVSRGDILVVNIDHKEKPFRRTYWFNGADVADKDCIHFTAKESGTSVDISWISATPIRISPSKGSAETRKPLKIKVPTPSGRDSKSILTNTKCSMAPVAAPDTTILILGTMPGDRSIRQGEYYGHPQNKFWKIISTATNNALPKTYLEKKDLLLKYKIGIWDLLDKANRKGSLDNAIRGQEPNDLDGFIDKHPHLKVIAFNGKTAKALFGKYFNKRESIRYVCLPSTSPANTNIGFDNICALWRKILTLTDD